MDSRWLEAQFKLNPGKGKGDLAAALKLSPAAVSKILAGTRQIKAQEYIAMRRFFGLSVEQNNSTRTDSLTIAPLVSGLADKKEETPDESWTIPARLLRGRTKAAPDQIKIFAVQENAMTPDFLPGEHVLVDLSDTKPSPPGIFIVSDGMGHIIRQCAHVPQSNPPSVRLSARNESFGSYTLPAEKAGIVGRVIAKLQWL